MSILEEREIKKLLSIVKNGKMKAEKTVEKLFSKKVKIRVLEIEVSELKPILKKTFSSKKRFFASKKFYGDFEGKMMLFAPQESIEAVYRTFFGEKVDDTDFMLDAFKELSSIFFNTIAWSLIGSVGGKIFYCNTEVRKRFECNYPQSSEAISIEILIEIRRDTVLGVTIVVIFIPFKALKEALWRK